MQKLNEISYERLLLIDDFIAELKVNFYTARMPYLKLELYTTLKKLSAAEYDYLINKIKADSLLYFYFAEVLFELAYEHSNKNEYKCTITSNPHSLNNVWLGYSFGGKW